MHRRQTTPDVADYLNWIPESPYLADSLVVILSATIFTGLDTCERPRASYHARPLGWASSRYLPPWPSSKWQQTSQPWQHGSYRIIQWPPIFQPRKLHVAFSLWEADDDRQSRSDCAKLGAEVVMSWPRNTIILLSFWLEVWPSFVHKIKQSC